ncbi:helix-turn-helix transcriptional regulator [Patescibacteria group bacterium]|nr:helix-turn-helix transcriptional regulator [Patescibacteria group bacterium]
MQVKNRLGGWLKEKCQDQGLSLRQAAIKTGLSHATICGIINGKSPTAETVKRLAQGFGNGNHHQLALEDNLLTLSGYRSERPQEDELSEPLAQLLDKLSGLAEPEIEMLGHFADYLTTHKDSTRGK